MAIPKKSSILSAAQKSIRKNLKFATLSFLFIIAYVTVFQKVFGAENSIVGVIFAIMMSASMAVSYTHLDVYKRQRIHRLPFPAGPPEESNTLPPLPLRHRAGTADTNSPAVFHRLPALYC